MVTVIVEKIIWETSKDGFRVAEIESNRFFVPMIYVELKRAGRPAELHIVSKGGHGYGLRPSANNSASEWPDRAASWMKHTGLLNK